MARNAAECGKAPDFEALQDGRTALRCLRSDSIKHRVFRKNGPEMPKLNGVAWRG